MPNLRPLAAQTIVIVGASSGIGLAAAKAAARRGARVFLISRNGPALQAICDDIASDGGVAAFAVADVGDAQALSAAADAAVAAFGPCDSWVHAAGVAIYAPLLETPADEHERLFRTNYWGVVNASRVAVPALRPRGGAFVVVGSVASDIGTPVLGAYAASKHAVKGFIDSLRIELLAERAPVSVTLVKPSGIGTPLAEHAANHQGAAAKVPPPAYSPEVAARAILHAVQHPRREIIVGGVGAFQRAGAILAPGLADRISSLVPPLLRDRRRPANVSNNLDHPRSDGRIRSPSEPSIPFSLYTGAVLHPGLALVAAGLVAGLIWALAGETGRAPRQRWRRP